MPLEEPPPLTEPWARALKDQLHREFTAEQNLALAFFWDWVASLDQGEHPIADYESLVAEVLPVVRDLIAAPVDERIGLILELRARIFGGSITID
jgi:hypothetical protein